MGIVRRTDSFLCNLKPFKMWIKEEQDELTNDDYFHALMDKFSAELYLGLSILIILPITLFFGNQILDSLFGLPAVNPPIIISD